MESVYDHKLTDEESNHLPWFTYPCIEYIRQLDISKLTIFEWGSGNSSLFFSKRCKFIKSIENNQEWFNFVSENKNVNQEVLFISDGEQYVTSLDEKYDIVIVDGFDRHNCVLKSIEHLSKAKLIILDNSNWYVETSDFIKNNTDFIQVDFHGMGPINDYAWTTTVFFSRDFDIKPIDNTSPKKPIGGNLIYNCKK
jgi:hypothetical protein